LAPGNKNDAKKSKSQALLDVDSDSRKVMDEAKWVELRKATRRSMVSVERNADRHAYSFGTSQIYVNGVIN